MTMTLYDRFEQSNSNFVFKVIQINIQIMLSSCQWSIL